MPCDRLPGSLKKGMLRNSDAQIEQAREVPEQRLSRAAGTLRDMRCGWNFWSFAQKLQE
jgi:hypothetical protein